MSLTTIPTGNTVSGTINSINSAIVIDVSGAQGVGFTLYSGTLAATIFVQQSFDGGLTWVSGMVWLDPQTNTTSAASAVLTNPNATLVKSIVTIGGQTHLQLVVQSYTSGSANAVFFSTNMPGSGTVPYSSNGGLFTPLKSDSVGGLIPASANLGVTATAATGVAVTATITGIPSRFQYITLLEITKYFTAANAASATPIVINTTNLNGITFTFGSPLGTIGSIENRIYTFPLPMLSSVAGTNSTIVCPGITGIIWRINVLYFLSL